MLLLLLLSCLLSTLFLFLSHPLTLGGTLLVQTIIITTISGLMYLNFFYSYVLFLIMVGGMLVMFMYMTSIASNEKFNTPNKIMTIFTSTMMTMLILSIMFMDNFLTPTNQYMTTIFSTMNSFPFSLNKFFNMPNYILSIMLMLYLLLTLIVAVKIVGTKMGPLRQK
uniref:NADH-ubiquinone oxidoreductase chain 6 n=1 Tax=Scolytinae sp. BMNH 1043133 TaxID=1903798 RepID=A0A343A4U7_9CUCU|nr:NADH dehydrogenase subunit 6 [Scolytinae sp. BMNH 1043133]